MRDEKLNIDSMKTSACLNPECVWRVFGNERVLCEHCWDGKHLASCRREQAGFCVCGTDSLLGSDPLRHPEITRSKVLALRAKALAQGDTAKVACCSAALAGDGNAVDACAQYVSNSGKN